VSGVREPSLDRLDLDGAIEESAERAGVITRRAFLAGAAGGSIGLLALAAERVGAQSGGPGPSDVAILNYALVLEYLQAAFYTEAQRMKALRGRAAEAAGVVGAVERAHVKAFLDVLGDKAVSRPSFDFQGTTEDQNAFLKTAVAFEDLAVAAYKGQAPRIKVRSALAAALAIHSVEARHAAWMRYLFGVEPASRAFDEPRSRQQILRVVDSTNFVTSGPSTQGRRTPSYTG
jgi:ferritin-like protein